jgi:hypothetical protein
MKTTTPKLSRRNFLLAVSAGTAASAAAIVAKKETDSSKSPQKGSESTTGYQVTEHVRNYYRTAKI